jgi:hypothetical protein
MLFAAVLHLDEALIHFITYITSGRVPNVLSRYIKTNSIHNKTKVHYFLENVNMK